MGIQAFDQYSLLHLAVGIIAYFWNVSLLTTIILHLVFEFLENTKYGIYFINHYMYFWPGGKPYPDSAINSICDTFSTIIGWLLAYYVDYLGSKYKWYSAHLAK